MLHQQHDDKESMLKNEISDFEMIDDGHQSSPKVLLVSCLLECFLTWIRRLNTKTWATCSYLQILLNPIYLPLIHPRLILMVAYLTYIYNPKMD